MEDPEEPKEASSSKTKKNKSALAVNKPQPEKKMKKTRKSRKPIKNKALESSDIDDENRKVDFNALSIHTLRKYRKFYRLPIASNLNKMELAREVNKHFPQIALEEEKTVISYFLHFTNDEPPPPPPPEVTIKEEPI